MLPLLRNSRGAAYIVSHSKVARSLLEPRAFSREASVCKKLMGRFGWQPKAALPKFWSLTLGWASVWIVAKFWISWFPGEFWIYMNLKSKFLDVLGRVMTPRCLNFILISSMGPRNSTKDTHVIFQPTLVHRSMCMQFIFILCTLKVQKLN